MNTFTIWQRVNFDQLRALYRVPAELAAKPNNYFWGLKTDQTAETLRWADEGHYPLLCILPLNDYVVKVVPFGIEGTMRIFEDYNPFEKMSLSSTGSYSDQGVKEFISILKFSASLIKPCVTNLNLSLQPMTDISKQIVIEKKTGRRFEAISYFIQDLSTVYSAEDQASLSLLEYQIYKKMQKPRRGFSFGVYQMSLQQYEQLNEPLFYPHKYGSALYLDQKGLEQVCSLLNDAL
jgi:hypothetical protein